tara:strand:- start:123 stop:521 length:399 start_codon:yes stop_codon:yes gene_type:complete
MNNCQIAQILFATHIIMIASCESTLQKKDFMETLNVAQKQAYSRIAKRRMIVYLYGGLFGSLIAKIIGKNLCEQALLIITTQVAYYMIYPWPEYMKDHIETQEQLNLWKNVNNAMKTRYSLALIIGVLSSFI